MSRNDTILILAALGIGAYALSKPLTKTGFAVAETAGGISKGVGGLADTVTGVGGEVVNLAGDVTGITGAVSENVDKILDATGGSASALLGLPENIIDAGKRGIAFVGDRIKNFKMPSFQFKNPETYIQPASNSVIQRAVSYLEEPTPIRAAKVNLEIAALTGDTSHLEVHTPLLKYASPSSGSSSRSRSSKSIKSKSQPAKQASSPIISTKSKSLTSRQKSELSSNLKKLGWA